MCHSSDSSSRGRKLSRLAAWLAIITLATSGFIPGPEGYPSANGATPVSQPMSSTSPASDAHNFVFASSGVYLDTLDPALAYDTASYEIIQNTYETLVFFNGADPVSFVPQLAQSYDLSGDGLTWTFHIRSGVTFQNGDSLTPSDVAYSLQRGLLQGGVNSPQWLLTEPFFGIGIFDITSLVDSTGSLLNNRSALQAWNPAELVAACQQVKAAIVADNGAGTVTMHLAQPWGPFLATLAQPLGSIMDKAWTINMGGWDDSCDTWQDWYAMSSGEDPLTAVTNGTGPFALAHWVQGVDVVLNRNDGYWRTPSQLAHVTIKQVPDEQTRLNMLQNDQADQASLSSYGRYWANQLSGEHCLWNISTQDFDCSVLDPIPPLRSYLGQPTSFQDEILFNFNISVPAGGNPYIGTGLLDGVGIPPDFFSDEHVRKAFNYIFDWETYNKDMWADLAIQPTTLLLPGMPGYDLSAAHYTHDLDMARSEIQASGLMGTGGDSLWNTGFSLTIPYNAGNGTRHKMADLLASGFQALSIYFHIQVISLPYSDYMAAINAGEVPIMAGGWLEDIHDPHNWYVPYLTGYYADQAHIPAAMKTQFQGYINDGVSATSFAARDTIYKQLNRLVYDDAPFILLGGMPGSVFTSRRVHGQIHNPIFPGNYYYPIYKDPPFSIKTPSIPSLKSPASKALLTGSMPVLDWNNSTLPKGATFGYYRLQVATDALFESLVLTQNIPGITNSTYTFTSDLDANTTYYWRVQACNLWDNPSAWSKVRYFRTALPAPISLASDGSIQDLRPSLTWDMPAYPGPAATGFTLQISTTSTFSKMVLKTNTATSAFDPTADLPAHATLFWRVAAKGANGPSAWSELARYVTGNPPSMPLLLLPKNKALTPDLRPFLDWKDSTVPPTTTFQKYVVQLATDSAFTSPVSFDVSGLVTDSNYTPATDLASATTYYWRVQACNTLSECSSWSKSLYFSTP